MPLPTAADLAEYAARRTRLMQTVGDGDIVIVPAARETVRNRDVHHRFRQDSDFWYLTGFPEPDAIAVLAPGRKQGTYLLFVRPRNPEREIWDGRRAGPEGAVRDYGAEQAFTIDQFAEQLPQLLAGRERIDYTLGEYPVRDAEITACVRQIRELSRRGPAAPAAFVALEATLHEQRLIKSAHELGQIRHACAVSARAHLRAMRYARPSRHEYQVAAEIHHEFELAGMQPGYGSIVGAGDNACILHYVENDAELRDGQLLLIDAGGEYRGYTADITRTFPVGGRYSGPQREIYELVLAAQLAAIAELKPGNDSGRPHQVATRVLTEGMVALGLLSGDVDELIRTEAHKRFYMHGTGHWLGMDVHDVGRYRLAGKHRPFAPGMVMTVEPGLYVAPGSQGVDPCFHGIGVRIEDDVLVTEGGPEVLTAGVPKAIAEVEALMREARRDGDARRAA
ncbi:MAG: aminopeptidase P N-terminal domain-containing protein [Gammaproteobacteria bacterium]|nr:aminopeptidase P N-terminal domain-containing protein [Gammaproteobacteria bacterium]